MPLPVLTQFREKDGVLRFSASPSRPIGSLLFFAGIAAAVGCARAAETNGWLLLMLFAIGSFLIALGAAMCRGEYAFVVDGPNRTYELHDITGFNPRLFHRSSLDDVEEIRRLSPAVAEIVWADGKTAPLRLAAGQRAADRLMEAADGARVPTSRLFDA